jgi:hypothetical protein
MSDEKRIAVGIAWYRREQWALLLSLIPDPEVFPHTYDEWLAKATDALRQATAAGTVARKVDVDVKALMAWASAEGRSPDGAGRAEYASHLLKTGDEKTIS